MENPQEIAWLVVKQILRVINPNTYGILNSAIDTGVTITDHQIILSYKSQVLANQMAKPENIDSLLDAMNEAGCARYEIVTMGPDGIGKYSLPELPSYLVPPKPVEKSMPTPERKNTKDIQIHKMFGSSDDSIYDGILLKTLLCPVCGTPYIHLVGDKQYLDGEDGYKATSKVRGDAVYIPIWCESGHSGRIVLGFHKGNTFAWFELDTPDPEPVKLDYHEYLKSPEWKARAKAAKQRAGNRCQLCNKKGGSSELHAHHRTYERLGDELPEDLIVLCANCHGKFHDKLNNG